VGEIVLQEENMTPQEEQRQIRAQAKIISDLYTSRLNAAGREFLRMMVAQVNQEHYLLPVDETACEQEVSAASRGAVVAVEGVKSADEIDRYLNGLLKFSRRLSDRPESPNALYISAEQRRALRNGTSPG
jgi:hypothetical protein